MFQHVHAASSKRLPVQDMLEQMDDAILPPRKRRGPRKPGHAEGKRRRAAEGSTVTTQPSSAQLPAPSALQQQQQQAFSTQGHRAPPDSLAALMHAQGLPYSFPGPAQPAPAQHPGLLGFPLQPAALPQQLPHPSAPQGGQQLVASLLAAFQGPQQVPPHGAQLAAHSWAQAWSLPGGASGELAPGWHLPQQQQPQHQHQQPVGSHAAPWQSSLPPAAPQASALGTASAAPAAAPQVANWTAHSQALQRPGSAGSSSPVVHEDEAHPAPSPLREPSPPPRLARVAVQLTPAANLELAAHELAMAAQRGAQAAAAAASAASWSESPTLRIAQVSRRAVLCRLCIA